MTKRLTTEEFKNKVYNEVENEYVVLGEYKNNRTKINIRHNVKDCNYFEYLVEPKSFLGGNRCPECSKKIVRKKPKTTKQFKKELYDLVGDEYTLKGEYNGATKKLKLEHKCGKIWEVTPNAFLSKGSRCFHCRMKEHNENQRKKPETFVKEIKELYGDDYKVLSDYTKAHDKILVEHKCGTKWKIRARHLLDNPSCPYCNLSKGELNVIEYLKSKNIKYEEQKTFEGLKDKRDLSYDFCLRDNADNITHLIEYQGIQHYFPIEMFGGESSYENQVRRDNIKREFAELKGIKLIEIPYTRKTYESIERFLDIELLM